MRHDVTTPAYLLRKTVDNVLFALSSSVFGGAAAAATATHAASTSATSPKLVGAPLFERNPSGWLPLYTMVTFRPDIAYGVARRKAEHQARLLSAFGWAIGGASTVAAAATAAVWWTRFRSGGK
jgi:kynurenine 3-monooxygenase